MGQISIVCLASIEERKPEPQVSKPGFWQRLFGGSKRGEP